MEASLHQARQAFLHFAKSSTNERNSVLRGMREALIRDRDLIERANQEDIEECRQQVEGGSISKSLFDRLGLYGAKFDSLMTMVESVERLDDPLNIVTYSHNMLEDASLSVHRVTCPIGVIAVIFESRPEAAVQIASLCIKSGNAVVLKGGKEARRTCRALVESMRSVPGISNLIQLAETREDIKTLLTMDKYVDLVIPRGGAELVRYCKTNSTIPVLGHADGVCSVYIDQEADLEMGIRIIVDAKTQYPAVCNAAETLLVHSSFESSFGKIILPLLEKSVQIRACSRSFALLRSEMADACKEGKIREAQGQDFRTEYCDLILNVKLVESATVAVDHINTNGSHHSDAIVTSNRETAEYFFQSVDSADVMWNCSTRFADGNRLGFGAEVGVSTNKIHARGPVGLEGLTTYKYRIYGSGNTVGKDGPNLVPIAKSTPVRRIADLP